VNNDNDSFATAGKAAIHAAEEVPRGG